MTFSLVLTTVLNPTNLINEILGFHQLPVVSINTFLKCIVSLFKWCWSWLEVNCFCVWKTLGCHISIICECNDKYVHLNLRKTSIPHRKCIWEFSCWHFAHHFIPQYSTALPARLCFNFSCFVSFDGIFNKTSCLPQQEALFQWRCS
jgi:hypothetical protein